MKNPSRIVDARTRENQRNASDPAAAVFVSAIAGSGKTHVLTERVKRLLLNGIKPERILCLTFTKAAAANMSNRLIADLGAWVRMGDDELLDELCRLQNVPHHAMSAARLAEARGIFAQAIETPGGLKIQTIHAFCDALLHQFPFEAGVPANFRELDAASEAELLAHAVTRLMGRAGAGDDALLSFALAEANRLGSDDTFGKLIRNAAGFRKLLDRILPTLAHAPHLSARLRAGLAIPPDLTLEAIDRALLSAALLPPAEWPAAIAELRAVEKRREDASTFADRLQEALDHRDESGRARAYSEVYLTSEGKLRSASALLPAELKKKAPRLAEILTAELERVGILVKQRWALETYHASLALSLIARAVIDDIEAAKRRDAWLAFDDLIAAANRLLDGRAGDWVRWKLDQGIEHVLIDEAQDTSAEQWQLAQRLSEEFFAGKGIERPARTFFVVGDDKQSIFSFQGAEPALFDRQRRRIANATAHVAMPFHNVSLDLSFRSAKPVLDAVNTVFADLERLKGVTSDSVFPEHRCARLNAPGLVEIWPLASADKPEALSAWEHPFLAHAGSDPGQELAGRLARHIRSVIGRDMVEDNGIMRPLRAGDVLILVRRRKALFEKLIRALKQHAVPVAGADRLVLTQHIAVMDLMALGEAVLLPDDDLTFASLMKSPLLGLDEDDLLALATTRGKNPLWLELDRRSQEKPHWQRAAAYFRRWLGLSRSERPYDFFAGVLQRDAGRARFLARLGAEADDAIAEFMAAALDFESRHVPTLQGFLVFLQEADAVVKREMDQGRDEVRVMTVHNAKGLQAKYVILPETTQVPHKLADDRLVEAASPVDGEPLLLWKKNKEQQPDIVAKAREREDAEALAEYYRLLYVAMTRAEDRLLVAGYPDGKSKGAAKNSWYEVISERLMPLCKARKDKTGEILAWTYPIEEDAASTPFSPAEAEPASIAHRPDWMDRPPPASPALRPIFAPSLLASFDERQPSLRLTSDDGLVARLRGDVLHRLLQSLLRLDPARREAAGMAYARRKLGDEGEAVVNEALAVLALPEIAAILGGSYLSEVAVAGDIVLPDGRSLTLSGRIDLLAVTPQAVTIIDYKSGLPPQNGLPRDYVAQLALYKQLMAIRFQGRDIVAAILWTRLPRLDRLGDDDMALALAAIAAAPGAVP